MIFQVIQWSIKYESVIYMNVEKMKHELIKQKDVNEKWSPENGLFYMLKF